MPKPIIINLGGQERSIRFNQYATIELNKQLFGNGFASPEMDALLNKCNDIIKENHYLFYNRLIYSGIIGSDYASGKLSPSCTLEDVSEWVGEMSNQDLTEFFVKVWNEFFDSMGVNLEKIKELEEQDKGEKKK